MSERKTYFVEVILPVPLHKPFTYRVPLEWNDDIKIGSRVIVPFGKSKFQTGIIVRIHEHAPKDYAVKYLEHLLDEFPIVTTLQLQFWKWISDYYMAGIGEVMNAALPANFKLASETMVTLHPDFSPNEQTLSEQEQGIIDLLTAEEKMDLRQLSEYLGIQSIQPVVKQLFNRRILLPYEELNDRFIPKTSRHYTLASDLQNDGELELLIERLEKKKNKTTQLDTLLLFLTLAKSDSNSFKPIQKSTLLKQGASDSSLKSLEKNGVLQSELLQISRFEKELNANKNIEQLSNGQQQALNETKDSFNTFNTTLLHGVTGSGKTEIYVHLIQEQLDQGKQVLFLLPEIALTTQLIKRLQAYFGELVGVYHSRFNQNERVEIWNYVLGNDPNRFRIILGARSAVLLPFQELGLIIVDEEHETSFKQVDPAPRYNGRDAAIVLATMTGAKVLLGSATPSMETYFNAKNKKYGLVELNERYGGMRLPEICFANVQKERKQQTMQSHFSSFLLEELSKTLEEGFQAILFQNRRGYTPLWTCEVCNWTPKCQNCDVSLTYHKHSNQLKCHYCSHVTAPIGTCSQCGSNRLRMVGFGTEKIEDELAVHYPNASIKRLDLDTTRSKHGYSTILTDFTERKIDVLIGTQMVTKGLDFEHVKLVGVLDADMLLNRPDFRAFERSYHLISQVAGRAGRKHQRGKVVIQTGDPDHWVLQRVMEHNYTGFYKSELMERQHYFYPPYYKLIEFTLKHKEENQLKEAAHHFSMRLRGVFKERVLGPDTPLISRIQNYHLRTVKLKLEKELSDKKIKEHLRILVDEFFSVPLHKSIRLVINVDPI